MATIIPERFVAKSGAKNRVGRIFVDYLRNGFGATTACAWSARARPGLGVSVPCAWDELGALTGGAHWTIRNLHERIEEHVDPWRAYAKTRQTLDEGGEDAVAPALTRAVAVRAATHLPGGCRRGVETGAFSLRQGWIMRRVHALQEVDRRDADGAGAPAAPVSPRPAASRPASVAAARPPLGHGVERRRQARPSRCGRSCSVEHRTPRSGGASAF